MTTPLERLQGGYYNSDPVSVANPGGFADGGHVVNFPAALSDLAVVAGGIVLDAAAIAQAGAMAEAAALSATTAGEAAILSGQKAGQATTAAEGAEEAAEGSEQARAAAVAAAGSAAASRQVAEEKANDATDAATAATEARDATTTLKDEVQDLRDETKAHRDHVDAIAAGAGLTQVQGDARYRQLGEAVPAADVAGLQDMLAAAIAALVNGAPAALDTLKEVADWIAAHEDVAGGMVAGIADLQTRLAILERPWTIKTGAYAAISGDRLLADTSAAAFTLTLPASGTVEVQDRAGTWPTKNLTINPGGGSIRGCAGSLVCDQPAHLLLVCPTGSTVWTLTKAQGLAA